MEKFDLYTFDRKVTGITVERGTGKPVPEGFYRLVVAICVFNSRGQLLIQQRTSDKSTWADKWDISSAGHVTAGESSQTGAQRELKEELGIDYNFSGIPPVFTTSFPHGFEDFYIIHKDIEICDLILQKEEVQSAKWASLEEIQQMIDEGSFIPYHKSLIEYIFTQKEKSGVHNN